MVAWMIISGILQSGSNYQVPWGKLMLDYYNSIIGLPGVLIIQE